MPKPSSLTTILLTALALGACSAEPEAASTAGDTSFDAPSALLHLAATPEAFEVETNDAETLTLTAPGLPGPSTVTVTLGELVEGGINIYEAVEEQLASFTELPEGASFGQTQLMADLGLAFMLRGRYQIEGNPVEELRIVLVHPVGNRLLSAGYVYPLGDDTSERGQQLMELFGEMSSLEPAGEPAAEAEETH
jgi:hypothetical protein